MSRAPDIQEIMRKQDQFIYDLTLSLPPQTQSLIFRLNAFIYTCNCYCNNLPQQKEAFYDLKEKFFIYRSQSRILFDATTVELEDEDYVIESFVNLERDLKFDFAWAENFFKSVELNFDKKKYNDFTELSNYISLSSGSIALFLCKIFNIDVAGYKYVQKLLASFEIVRMVRDIPKNNYLNRNYFPLQLMQKYSLSSLQYKDLVLQDRDFASFIKEILKVYNYYSLEGNKGAKFFPKNFQDQIQAAIGYYQSLANEFQSQPMLIVSKRKNNSSFIEKIFNSIFS